MQKLSEAPTAHPISMMRSSRLAPGPRSAHSARPPITRGSIPATIQAGVTIGDGAVFVLVVVVVVVAGALSIDAFIEKHQT